MRAVISILVLAVALGLSRPAAGQEAIQETTPAPLGQSERLFVFVSSSMPEASLTAVARDAAPLGAPVLLRGLVGASLQETLARLAPLTATGAALEIDPLLFEAYGIEQAPAVVLTCGARGEGPYAVAYGAGPSQALPVLRRILRCP